MEGLIPNFAAYAAISNLLSAFESEDRLVGGLAKSNPLLDCLSSILPMIGSSPEGEGQ
jgi:hypothetical protein